MPTQENFGRVFEGWQKHNPEADNGRFALLNSDSLRGVIADFGFDIPQNATIDTIAVEVEHVATGADVIDSLGMNLQISQNGDDFVTIQDFDVPQIPIEEIIVTFDNTAVSLPLAHWTPALVNSEDLTLRFNFPESGEGDITYECNFVRVIVSYDAPGKYLQVSQGRIQLTDGKIIM
tara:strand:+ start:87 stop:617 length:531 start_codon:yes stop_codon:yes gene_type:complete